MRNYFRIPAALMLLGAAVAAPLSSQAIPAYPGILNVKQADGTTLAIRYYGDERSRYATTEDGYLLTTDEAGTTYYYASQVRDGRLVSSGIKAVDAGKRTAEATSFLKGLDSNMMVKAMNEKLVKSLESNSSMMKIQAGDKMCINNSFPTKGKPKAFAILVEFQDKKFRTSNPREHFEALVNSDNYTENGATGSVRKYYLDSSDGQLDIDFDILGPVTLDHEQSYYGQNYGYYDQDRYPYRMAIEALKKLDDTVDFSIYDNDGDGYIDNTIILYADGGEATGGGANSVWPHSADIWNVFMDERTEVDNVRLNHYLVIDEWSYIYDRPEGIGVFAHEFGHALGLPDLYDPTYQNLSTPGVWTIMDQGSYNNDTMTPPLFSVYEAYCMGWREPKPLTPGEYTLTGDYDAYYVDTDTRNEFFMFEHRNRKNVWDSYLPLDGMLVWHIDFSRMAWSNNSANVDAKHMRIDLVRADGRRTESNSSLKNDPFPGSSGQYDCFDAENSRDKFVSWTGETPDVSLSNIRRNDDGSLSFTVNSTAAIDDISADSTSDAKTEYFSLEGVRLAQPQPGRIVIVRRGTDVTKQIYR